MLQRVAPVHVSAALQQPDLQPAAAQGRGGGAHPSQGAQLRLHRSVVLLHFHDVIFEEGHYLGFL